MADGDPRALSSSPLNSSLLASPSSFSASSRSGLNRAPHFREIEKTFFSALPSSPSSSSSSSSGVPSFIHSSFSHYVNNDGDLEKTTESFVFPSLPNNPLPPSNPNLLPPSPPFFPPPFLPPLSSPPSSPPLSFPPFFSPFLFPLSSPPFFSPPFFPPLSFPSFLSLPLL